MIKNALALCMIILCACAFADVQAFANDVFFIRYSSAYIDELQAKHDCLSFIQEDASCLTLMSYDNFAALCVGDGCTRMWLTRLVDMNKDLASELPVVGELRIQHGSMVGALAPETDGTKPVTKADE